MQTTTSSSSPASAVNANGTSNEPSTSDEFEAIFNQMTALVSTIDEELEHSASTKRGSSGGGGGVESITNLASTNPTTNSAKMKSLGSSGGPEFYHHTNHLNHHHQFSHYHSQSLDDNHQTINTSSTSTNGHRTDSPDADSAFSDSISLVSSTEQSSSSSSSSTTSSTSGKCSSTSTSSTGVQPQFHYHQNTSSSSHLVHQPPPPPPPILSPPNNFGLPVPPNSPLNSTMTVNSNSSLSDKMNSCSIESPLSLSSTTSSGTISANSVTSSSCISSLDHQLMALNQQQELFFEQLGRCTTSSEVNQKQNGLMKSPTKLEKQAKGFDKKKSGKGNDIGGDDDDDDGDALYLKVFAQDNSAKSLLADERMNIGAICGQLAAKNHIALDTSLCIIEHMPHLYLERFFEDHESLVENVLHWGRDSSNKLYFMQRSDKYDLFHRPERYLICGEILSTNSKNSSSSSSSNDSTLKSSSGPASDLLRHDLIQQFFNSPNSNGSNKVPEVEGELFLRAEGKKTWKKYFFTLRSSGLYYCPTGKLDKSQRSTTKSTKELLCLATFDLNAVYLGFGWRKKFKAPTDFGFALKHPQVQAKAPKHIKYLCAESEDQLRLWLTGVRIAKYGRQLWTNWERFRQEANGGGSNGNAEKETLSKPVNFDTEYYHSHPHSHPHLTHQQSVVTMRSNRSGLNRDESARSSSTSSASSGCLSEGVASTGSGTTSVSNPGGVHHHLNHHQLHHHQNGNGGSISPMEGGGSLHYLGSSTHNNFNNNFSSQPQSTMSLSSLPSQTSGFDTDSFPLGTIKRKPSVQSMPKIPLTKNTRNLALQSEDVLLEHENETENGGPVYDSNMIGSHHHGASHDHDIYGGTVSSEVPSAPFQRGTFLSGTLRRSTTEERMRANKNLNSSFNQMMMNSSSNSPMHLSNTMNPVVNSAVHNGSSYLSPPPAPVNQQHSKSDSEDDLPLPPPPPLLLKESESTLSLTSATTTANSTSFPPPPLEVLQSSNSPQNQVQQAPISSTAVAYGSMTPQPQPKNGARLNRRLSDLSSNSTFFLNNRNGPSQEFNLYQHQNHPQSPQSPSYLMANSRASIATSGEGAGGSGLYGPSAGFVTLKPYHNRGASISGNSLNGGGVMNSRHHRQLTLDLNAALSKYGTTPRIRNDQQQLMATMAQQYEVQNGGQNLSNEVTPPPQNSIYQSNNFVKDGVPLNSGTYQQSANLYQHQNSNFQTNGGGIQNQYNPGQFNGGNEMLPPPSEQQHPQMLYQQQTSYLNGQSLPSPPPPPPPPAHQNYQQPIQGSAINSRPSTNENVIYMSISPHLLQKHQAMAVVNDVYQAHNQPIYGPTLNSQSPLSPSLPPPPPPEQIFLKSMERVMAKKWHVAQMLRSTESEYYGSTPGQVLGFRDPAYLPPREKQQHQQMTYQQTPPPPQMPYYPYQGPPGPMAYQQQQQIYGTQPSTSPSHLSSQGPPQQIYAGGSLGKRVPPPPPKRSENTHLTLGQQQSSRR